MQNFSAQLAYYQELANQALSQYLGSTEQHPQQLYQAMHYATLMGGKRIRPALIYATCQALKTDINQSHSAAAAIEMIHAYSLVHDDLPAMDDDDLRRGQATCHKKFDEATAILAADGLQALAFECLSFDENLPVGTRLRCCQILSAAAGPTGMVGGQAIDCLAVDQILDLAQLSDMHQRKTGALIQAAVEMAIAIADKENTDEAAALYQYVQAIGLAFQVQDDILDVISDTETLGKTQGADTALNKPTFVSLLGLEGAQAKAQALYEAAIENLQAFDQDADFLRELAKFIVQRTH